jgi:hypothetical protein
MLLGTLRQCGLVYIRVEQWDELVNASTFEIEPLGQAATREELVNQIRTQIYPPVLFAEHLRDRLATFLGQSVTQVDRIYRTTLGFPVPLKEDMVASAIRSLVEDPDTRSLGLRGPRGRDFCGQFVELSPSELDEAILSPPWSRSGAPQPTTASTPIPLPTTNGGASLTATTPTQPLPRGVDSEMLNTPPARSLGELRQQTAARLATVEGPNILDVSFRILVAAQDTELSGFSSGVRGSLSGRGSLDVQIEITCPGPMSKADVEAKCEQLPQLPQGMYSARLRVLRKREGNA